jgi:peptidoglycan/LPS O-acetylase OafA/YrhL
MKNKYYPFFDYLRIILACVVMLGHDKVINIPHSGNLSVQVFFALSGWLIGGILLNLKTADLPRFYFNRAIRIWVPYYIALTLLLCASLLKEPVTYKWFEFVFYKASFVYNLFGPPQLAAAKDLMPLNGTGNHFWSVNAEEQFYLIAPLFLVAMAARFGRNIATWIIFSVTAWWFEIYSSIIFGVLAAVIANRIGSFQLLITVRIALYVIFASSISGLYYGIDYEKLAPIFAICLVLLLAVQGKQHKIGKLLGGMSYPLYLNHWIGVFAGNVMLSPFGLRDSPERQIISIIINLAVSAALYWLIDRRILLMRSQLFSDTRAKTAMYSGYASVIAGIGAGLFIF